MPRNIPAYNYGMERRQAVRHLRRIIGFHDTRDAAGLNGAMQHAARWLAEHDEMRQAERTES
jgi:hypothetical protein